MAAILLSPAAKATALAQSAADQETDREALKAALAEHHGNVRAVATAFGVSTDTIYRRLRDFGLSGWHAATFPLSGRQPKKKRPLP